MPRPRKGKGIAVWLSVRVTPELHADAVRAANRAGVSMSGFVEEGLRLAVERVLGRPAAGQVVSLPVGRTRGRRKKAGVDKPAESGGEQTVGEG